jgi:hypothetical protein
MPLLSQRDYATHRGCSPSAVARAVSEGRITTVDGKIDPDKADKEWVKNTNPAYHPQKTENRSSAMLSLTESKARNINYDTLNKKLKYEKDSGKVIDAAESRKKAFNAARAARDRIMSVPHKIIPKLIKLTDPAEMTQLLEDAIEKELYGLADFLDEQQQF